MAQLSPNFDLDEFTVSQAASRFGLKNIPPPNCVANLAILCREVLEPLRKLAGKPIIITSGYRSPEVNKVIGGSKFSQHMQGQAADIIIPGMKAIEVCYLIVNKLAFDQVIHEFGSWCHVSYVTGNNRKQALTIDRQGTRGGL